MRQRARVAGVCSALVCLTVAWAAPAAAARSGLAAPATAKPAGYKIVSADFSAPAGLDTSGSVACPKVKGAQTVPLSGGVLNDGTSLETSVNSSWPTAKGWSARVSNASAAANGFTVYAVCAKKMTGYVQQESAAVSNPVDSQNGAGYKCPKGDALLGGGAQSTSHSTLVNLDSSWPAGTSIWYVYMNNASTTPASFHVYHTCAKLNVPATSYQLVAGTPVVSTAGTQSGASVFCPGGLSSIGGGLLTASLSIDVTLNTTFPFAGGWGGDENNASGANTTVTAYVLCAS
jgi:hypothetical protein